MAHGYCPACDKLVSITPAPRDPLGRPLQKVTEHERTLYDDETGEPVTVRCNGSGRKI